MKILKLLYPGMHLKRWIALLVVGLVALSLGIAYLLVELYRNVPLPEEAGPATLQFLPRTVRATLFITVGVAVASFALWRLNKSVLDTVAPNGADLVDQIYNYRYRARGPKIVAIGGGTGLSTLLRGLKAYTSNVTAIVTVADDGGSSGRLRRELGVLPPGDFRNCIVALAEAEPLMARLFQYRFGRGSDLEGHSFGNLFIVAMSGITGNFEEAIREASRVLAVRGQILPSTLDNVTLCAQLEGDDHVRGESEISKSTQPIKRLYMQPEHPAAYPEAVKAILEADIVVVGPGSLYTSVLPNLMVEGIAKAILASDALKVYICNVATQRGETDGFSVADHVRAIQQHLNANPFHFVIANNNVSATIPPEWRVSAVAPIEPTDLPDSPRVVFADVVDDRNPLRHDPDKVSRVLLRLYYEKAEAVGSGELAEAVAAS
jgi:uncharacterized cofD-like protein